MDDLAPRTATRSRCAAVIDAAGHVACLRQNPMTHPVATSPTVQHPLTPPFAISIPHHPITFLRIEVGRIDPPAVQLHPLADVAFDKLTRRLFQHPNPR